MDAQDPAYLYIRGESAGAGELLSAGELGAGEFKGGTSTWRVRKPRESVFERKYSKTKQLEWVTNRQHVNSCGRHCGSVVSL